MNLNLHPRKYVLGRFLCPAIVFAIACSACRDDVSDTIPAALPGTTWKFDDFYITFVSDTALTVHDEDPNDVYAEGTYSMVDGFIEVALDDRVRAGSWDGKQLIVDGMVGRLTSTASQ